MTRPLPLPAALAAVLAAAAPAAADEPCEHVVAAGETLSRIARDRLGDADFSEILRLNRDRIDDPDSITSGMVLRLPCPTDDAAVPAPPPAPDAPQPATPQPAAPAEAPFRALYGGDAGALAVAEAEALHARLAAALPAPQASRPETAPAPASPEASLAATGPDGAAALSYPWIRLDCARLERLPPALARRCATLDLSAPIGELAIVWIVRPDGDAATAAEPGALAGRVVCRPAGAFDGDLAAAGLAPPRAGRLAPATAAECLDAVGDGRADVASLTDPAARQALAARHADAQRLVRNPALASSLTLHAAARRDSPAGRAALAALDAGLAALRDAEADPDDAAVRAE